MESAAAEAVRICWKGLQSLTVSVLWFGTDSKECMCISETKNLATWWCNKNGVVLDCSVVKE